MPNRRAALITGGSGGLGGVLAARLSEAGYEVVIHYFKNKERAEELCRKIQEAGRSAVAIPADLQSSGDCARLFQAGYRSYGRIDLLINAAGVIRDRFFSKMTESDWDKAVQINLRAVFYGMRAAAPFMRDQGGGQIINIGSLAAKTGRIGQANYTAAKAGLIALTQSGAREFAAYNIRVNVVFPGLLSTPLFLSLPGPVRKRLTEESLLKKTNTLEEVCAFIIHLASMRNVSGQVFNLDSRIAS